MRTPVLYRVIRWFVRTTLRVYFDRLEVTGREHVPRRGPVVFAANHPQSITDTLVLGLAAGRMVHYVAHSGLFRNPPRAFFLRRVGVIPVYRAEDPGSEDAAGSNVGMFSACREILERGGAVGMFPEGTSSRIPRMGRFKTGAARIVLETEAARGFALGAVAVPVGITFESRRRFRTRVLVRFGEPVPGPEWASAYGADPQAAVRALTDVLETRTRNLVLDLQHVELEDLVEDLERFCRDDLLADRRIRIRGESAFERAEALSREIARAVDFHNDHDPETVWRLERGLDAYHRRLNSLHVSDEALRRESAASVPGEAAGLLAFALAGLPVAVFGAIFNGLPYRLTGWIAARLAADETKYHLFQITVGTAVYLLYYPPLLYLAVRALGPAGAAVFLIGLVPTGLFARWFARALTRKRGSLRFAYLSAEKGLIIQGLRQRRAELAREIDALVGNYLRLRSGEGPGRGEAP